jgi:hypothetical protein
MTCHATGGGPQGGRYWRPTRPRHLAVATAKLKAAKVDAAISAQLLAAGYLPSVWMPGAEHNPAWVG